MFVCMRAFEGEEGERCVYTVKKWFSNQRFGGTHVLAFVRGLYWGRDFYGYEVVPGGLAVMLREQIYSDPTIHQAGPGHAPHTSMACLPSNTLKT